MGREAWRGLTVAFWTQLPAKSECSHGLAPSVNRATPPRSPGDATQSGVMVAYRNSVRSAGLVVCFRRSPNRDLEYAAYR